MRSQLAVRPEHLNVDMLLADAVGEPPPQYLAQIVDADSLADHSVVDLPLLRGEAQFIAARRHDAAAAAALDMLTRSGGTRHTDLPTFADRPPPRTLVDRN